MSFNDNERLQEFFILVGDAVAPVKRAWWYALVAAIVLTIPGYHVAKTLFVTALVAGYDGPQIIYNSVTKEPLQILDKKIFSLPNNTYSGYVKIKNTNLEWGVEGQEYTAEFKTAGGTVVNSANRVTFILPASEKLIILPRFNSSNQPITLDFELADTHFVHKPDISINYDIERTNINNTPDGLVVSSAFKNFSPFTIRQVDIPVAIYNNRGEIIAVNFTYVNEVKASETRTFQYTWPGQIPGAIRAEVNPEVNIFDRNILSNESGVSPFNSIDRPE